MAQARSGGQAKAQPRLNGDMPSKAAKIPAHDRAVGSKSGTNRLIFTLGTLGLVLAFLGYRLYPTIVNKGPSTSTPLTAVPVSGDSGASPSSAFESPLNPGQSITKFGLFSPPPLFHPVLAADSDRKEAIVEATRHSWKAYERYAWGADECHPISKTGTNLTQAGGVGYQIVDALDTFLVMGMEEEYKRAAGWVREHLSFEKDAEFSTFETTIRLLGGLLSAHHLTSLHPSSSISADSDLYLDKATDLADRLLSAFDTPSGIPLSSINLARRVGIPDAGNNGMMSTAEAASLQLEFKYLSHLTGDYVYWRTAEKVMKIIQAQSSTDGIVPIFINPQNGQFVASEIRLGSRGDSYYEYLLKQYLQTSKQETIYKEMYDGAMRGVKTHLVGKTSRSGLVFTQELVPARHPETNQHTWQIIPKQDHLVCFIGGSLILGVTEGRSARSGDREFEQSEKEDMALGQSIIDTCLETYKTETGLGPEIAMFRLYTEPEADDEDWYIKPQNGNGGLIDGRNILRPETVESLFLAYRATGDNKYREAGWRIFEAFEEHCRLDQAGFVGIADVRDDPPRLLDTMETFWIGETLKYLYLLFDDSSHIPLDEYVFNTEAHILPIFAPAHLSDFARS